MINTQWKEFRVGDLYTENKIIRKVKTKEITDDGKTPVYSSTTSNQGIDGYTTAEPDYILTEDTPFYVIFGDHTRALNITKESFCVKDNVKVLTPSVYNENAILFINTIIQKTVPNLGYSRHWLVAKDTLIHLPVTPEGTPDWSYMEAYIREKQQQVKLRLEQLTSINETPKTLVYSALNRGGG